MGFLNLLFKKFSYDKNLNKSEADIKKMQSVKLKNLVKYAFRHSNFYQKIILDQNIEYEDIDDIDLKDLPTTNKKMIMNNFDEVVTDQNLSKEKVINFIDNNPEQSA